MVGDIVAKNLEENIIDLNEEDDQSDEEMPEASQEINYTIVDETNIQHYSIKDVVLPIIGSSVYVPKQSLVYSILNELLQKEQVEIDLFDRLEKEFNVKGGWRKMVNHL